MSPAPFLPLHARHAPYAVQTDLGRIGPFGFGARPEEEAGLLYSDLQTNVDTNISRRLGSGRSGFHGGRYLKGVGRTMLAANWGHPTDHYHSSGHLLPSAAAREFLASCYLEALGAGDTLVSCEGVLLAPLPPGAERYIESSFPGRELERLAPADRRLQAITVKSGGFARLSNFVWAFSHWRTGAPFLASLFLKMVHYLSGPTEPEVRPGDVTPETVADCLEHALERLFQAFERFFRAGVYWGSFHNNFTADGRFLDLETPLVFGAPFIGVLATPGDLPSSVELAEAQAFVGCEVLQCLRQFRAFLSFLSDRLEWLVRNAWEAGELERRFLRDTAEALRARFPPSHGLMDERALGERLTATLASALALPPGAEAELATLVEAQCRLVLGGEPRRRRKIPLVPVDLQLADLEPALPVVTAVPRFLEGYVGQTRAGRSFNETLRQVEEATDVPTALHLLREAEATLRGATAQAGCCV